jgi:hypothetical protein
MHAAQASAKRAALVDFHIGPFQHAEIFWNSITIMAGDMKGVGVLGDEPVSPRA